MTSKFNYLVPFYFGLRGNENYNARLKDNKFFFAEKHIEFLENYSEKNIEKVIFVVNLTSSDNQEEITNFFAKESSKISNDVECTFVNGIFSAKGKLGQLDISVNSNYNIIQSILFYSLFYD